MSIWLGNIRLDTDVDMSAYAKDSDVIHKTGDEFIAGDKTFANTVTFLQIINGTATINTDICAELGLNFEDVKAAFAPYCTKVESIQTAESFE